MDEPWDGYARLRAALAAVRLHESAHSGRRSVLEAVDRRLART